MDDILDNINEGVLGWKNKANLMNELLDCKCHEISQ